MQPRVLAPEPVVTTATPAAIAHAASAPATASMTRRSRRESDAREACWRCQ
jgi:hypothetical protein